MRLFAEVFRGGGVKRQSGCRERQFSAFSLAVFSDTLEMRPALLYGDRQSVVSLSVIPKCMTLNGYFALNSVFLGGLAGSDRATLESNCMKTNKDKHTLSAVQIFDKDSTFRQYTVCADIRSRSLERRR